MNGIIIIRISVVCWGTRLRRGFHIFRWWMSDKITTSPSSRRRRRQRHLHRLASAKEWRELNEPKTEHHRKNSSTELPRQICALSRSVISRSDAVTRGCTIDAPHAEAKSQRFRSSIFDDMIWNSVLICLVCAVIHIQCKLYWLPFLSLSLLLGLTVPYGKKLQLRLGESFSSSSIILIAARSCNDFRLYMDWGGRKRCGGWMSVLLGCSRRRGRRRWLWMMRIGWCSFGLFALCGIIIISVSRNGGATALVLRLILTTCPPPLTANRSPHVGWGQMDREIGESQPLHLVLPGYGRMILYGSGCWTATKETRYNRPLLIGGVPLREISRDKL